MTEELRVYVQANRAIGALAVLLVGDEAHREHITNAIREIDYGLDALLVAAEKPETPPAEEASPLWHSTGIPEFSQSFPDPGWYLTYSVRLNEMHVLNCRWNADRSVDWVNAAGRAFPVDYWRPLPSPPGPDNPA